MSNQCNATKTNCKTTINTNITVNTKQSIINILVSYIYDMSADNGDEQANLVVHCRVSMSRA